MLVTKKTTIEEISFTFTKEEANKIWEQLQKLSFSRQTSLELWNIYDALNF